MKSNKKSDLIVSMSVIGILGLLVIIIAVAVVACSNASGKKTQPTKNNTESTSESAIDTETQAAELVRMMAVVKMVDTANEKLLVYDIDQNATITLSFDSAVDLKDAFGQVIAFSQLHVGDIVEAKYDAKTMRPETAMISGKSWEREDVKNMVIDTTKRTIAFANDVYQYTDELVATSNGLPVDIGQITSSDQVIVKGYKDTVWSITLVKGHGTLILMNHSAFVGGVLEVGNRISFEITEKTEVSVSAGIHDIVITMENMEPFTGQVLIEEGKTVTLDLGTVAPKEGTVEFVITQKEAKVLINDQVQDLTKPIVLPFGDYNVRVEAETFVPWENKITVSQAYLRLEVDLSTQPVYLHVDAPTGCELYIDSGYVGMIPITTPITPGNHTLTIRKDGYYSKMESVVIEDNGKDSYFTFPDLLVIPAEETTTPTTTPAATN